MGESDKPKRDMVDIVLRMLTPVIAGLLIAWAGFVSDWTLTSISSKQESARLITELQIRREQAESELRKDVFDQALQAFLLTRQERDNSIKGMSKQLLRLELLALNFGDSLSLSPLFTELREDLRQVEPSGDAELSTFLDDKGDLRKRLYSLARRIADAQMSSLAQHGVTKRIRIPLVEYTKNPVVECDTYLYENDFTWPENEVRRQFGIYDERYKKVMEDDEIKSVFANKEAIELYRQTYNEARLLELDGIKRYLDISISNVDHCNKLAKITIIFYKERDKKEGNDGNSRVDAGGDDPSSGDVAEPAPDGDIQDQESGDDLLSVNNAELVQAIERSFQLDYFNFPMVDNTRLSNNHRFAIVMNEFDLKSSDPHIELEGIIFPSEYASQRDRPGMQEARELLESALDRDEDDE